MSKITITRRRFAATAAAAGVFMPALGARAQAITLRWGDGQAANHPSPMSAARAAAAVKEKTGGRVDLQSFPAGQLGGSRDMSSGARPSRSSGRIRRSKRPPPSASGRSPFPT